MRESRSKLFGSSDSDTLSSNGKKAAKTPGLSRPFSPMSRNVQSRAKEYVQYRARLKSFFLQMLEGRSILPNIAEKNLFAHSYI